MGPEVIATPTGEFVRYEDYARLKAEVERVGADNAHLHKGIYSLSLNVAQLKDEVERLTKAGDYMASHLEWEFGTNPSTDSWNAAKEGKPSL
jgi:hypothetical protein